ncbi:MAG: YbgC/FadM family acyl-CoA thioesterase [Rickettsiales bacterium]|nr:YbgC/FadM family acyl-CoA thioesterase [Rickettsiales bacterium]
MIYQVKRRVCFCDTDAGGVVYHSKYLDFCETARLEYFVDIGLTQKKLSEEYNLAFVVKTLNINYKNPAKLENILVITIETIDLKGVTVNMKQHIYRDNLLLVECDLKLVAVNNNFKLVRKFPEEMVKTINFLRK